MNPVAVYTSSTTAIAPPSGMTLALRGEYLFLGATGVAVIKMLVLRRQTLLSTQSSKFHSLQVTCSEVAHATKVGTIICYKIHTTYVQIFYEVCRIMQAFTVNFSVGVFPTQDGFRGGAIASWVGDEAHRRWPPILCGSQHQADHLPGSSARSQADVSTISQNPLKKSLKLISQSVCGLQLYICNGYEVTKGRLGHVKEQRKSWCA